MTDREDYVALSPMEREAMFQVYCREHGYDPEDDGSEVLFVRNWREWSRP